MPERLTTALLVVTLAAFGFACGGTETATPGAATTGSGEAPASSARATPPAPANRCPLTAEQVAAAVGAPVIGPQNGVCQFEPADRKAIRPTVLFVRQFSGACTGTVPAENGLSEQVPGLGPTVYVADESNGTRILVCQGQTPFELVIDADTQQRRRDAAIALARQILAAS